MYILLQSKNKSDPKIHVKLSLHLYYFNILGLTQPQFIGMPPKMEQLDQSTIDSLQDTQDLQRGPTDVVLWKGYLHKIHYSNITFTP